MKIETFHFKVRQFNRTLKSYYNILDKYSIEKVFIFKLLGICLNFKLFDSLKYKSFIHL